MAKDDLSKVLLEIQKMDKQRLLLKSIKEDDQTVVKRAFESVKYMEKLKDKQIESFKKIQLHKPEIANILLKIDSGTNISKEDAKYLSEELEKDDEAYVSSKHLRLTLVQEALLDYFARHDKKNHSEYIREIYYEKMCSLLKDVE